MTHLDESKPEPTPPAYSASSSSDQSSPDIKAILNKLDHQIDLYRSARVRAELSPNDEQCQAEYNTAAEILASTMKTAADAHPDSATGEDWRRKAKNFTNASPSERDSALEEIGKGLLKIVLIPFQLVGASLYAVGGILQGVSSVLKGLGRFGATALYKNSK